ncbi:hypothetical protein BBJ28_00015381, partial [Nothophytophthora sp. Chile5]
IPCVPSTYPNHRHHRTDPYSLDSTGIMRFRPCIDIHAGEVKQIVGSTLTDGEDASPVTNFVSSQSAGDFARYENEKSGAFYRQMPCFTGSGVEHGSNRMYKADGLVGGHVIMLGASEPNKQAALQALHAYPGGLQVGGGINADNCQFYVENGASHVIVTSYVFRDGQIDYTRLETLKQLVGKQHLVLDLSCRKKPEDDKFYVMTDRWQKFTTTAIECGFSWIYMYYTPPAATKVDLSIGSALDVFGGDIRYEDVVAWDKKRVESTS